MKTNKTAIGKEKQLVPALRFKEFDGEWEVVKLGDITKYTKGFAFKSNNYRDKGIRIVRISDLGADSIKANTDKVFIDYDKALEFTKYKLNKGNIIITTVGSKPEMVESAVGRGVFIHGENEGLLNQNMLKFENISQIENSFVIGLINSPKYQYYIKGIARGNANQANVTVVDLLRYKVAITNLPEQQKIATFLSSIDKKIQQLTRKKALLESYKKGLMQQLFSGTLRFKDTDGKDFPDWEEKLYGDIFSFYPTNSFSRINLNYENGTVKNIHYGDIHTKFSTLFNIQKEDVPYLNSEINITRIKEECYCQEGDLVIADASEDYSDIGKAIELIELNGEKLIAGLHTFLARPNKTKMYIGFSGYLVQAWYIRKQIMTIAQGTKVLGLSTTRMVKLKVNIPCIPEQQKIANYLSNIDTKIQTVGEQITKAQHFKKGLLQQLFV